MLRSSRIRYPVDPRDVPAEKIARRLHLTLAEFEALKDDLFGRGFPRPDLTTHHYDLRAVDAWMDVRSGLTGQGVLTAEPKARNATEVFGERRGRNGGQG
jgi:hypothetical protein